MTAGPASPLAGGYDLDARYVPQLGVTVILNHIGPATLCAIHPQGGRVPGFWLDGSTSAAAAEWIEQFNTAGYNLYFTLNAPLPGLAKKPSKSKIVELRGIGADIDAKDGRSLDEAFAAIYRVGVSPNLIIATGGGFQPIWLLPEPLSATNENVHLVEATGARIVRVTGSDPVQNIDRILRIPFTTNFPNATKAAAGRVVCCSGLVVRRIGGSG
jgi:hypothetical protein